MNYAIEQRLRFIDFLLAMYGHVGRKELVSYFGISAPQATRDFRVYKNLAPGNCVFDVVAKRYQRSLVFKPHFDHGVEHD